MTKEGNSLVTMALIEEMLNDYKVSLNIHTSKDQTYYVVMVIWTDTLSKHVSGGGDSLYAAVTEAYDNLIKFLSK